MMQTPPVPMRKRGMPETRSPERLCQEKTLREVWRFGRIAMPTTMAEGSHW